MKKVIRDGVAVDALPFDNPPDEFLFYVRDRWLAGLDERESNSGTLDDRLIAYLESEAVAALHENFPGLPMRPVIDRDRPIQTTTANQPRKRFSPRPAPTVQDTYEAAFERWRHLWVTEAYHHLPHSHQYPRKVAAALNILVGAAQLRTAIESNNSERAAALGMMIAFEAMNGGYSLDLESRLNTHDAIAQAKKTRFRATIGKKHDDLETARKACIQWARDEWIKDATLLIGVVASNCRAGLLRNLDKLPTLSPIDVPELETIKGWLRAAAAQGVLSIPAAAQRRGRPPSKTAK